jgi:5'-deoxynucleotidase YfbR-like HD superfamily hydrolase
VRPENLVHHVGVVSIISAYLVNKMTEQADKEIFTSQECCSLMMRAVVHDMDEIITGDIVRPTKYANIKMLKLIKQLEEESIGKVIERFNLPMRWEEDWRQAKKDKIGLVLKVADTIAVVMTCYREVTLYSNNQFRKVAEEAHDHLREFIKDLDIQNKTNTDEKMGYVFKYLIDFALEGLEILYRILPTNITRYGRMPDPRRET